MNITENTLTKLIYYLRSLQKIITTENVTTALYADGTTVGQITFHVAQAVNHWLRVALLHDEYERVREKEFTATYSFEEISQTLELALRACEEIIQSKIQLEQSIEKVTIPPGNATIDNVYMVILHLTSHTAEHWGEINNKLHV